MYPLPFPSFSNFTPSLIFISSVFGVENLSILELVDKKEPKLANSMLKIKKK